MCVIARKAWEEKDASPRKNVSQDTRKMRKSNYFKITVTKKVYYVQDEVKYIYLYLPASQSCHEARSMI